MNPSALHVPMVQAPVARSGVSAPAWGQTGQPTGRDAGPGAFARELLAQQAPDASELAHPSPLVGAAPPAPATPASAASHPAAARAASAADDPAARARAESDANDRETTADEPDGTDGTDEADGVPPDDRHTARARTPRTTTERWRRASPAGEATTAADAAALEDGADTAATGDDAAATCAGQADSPNTAQACVPLTAEALHRLQHGPDGRTGSGTDGADATATAGDGNASVAGARARTMRSAPDERPALAAGPDAAGGTDATRALRTTATRHDAPASGPIAATDAARTSGEALSGALAGSLAAAGSAAFATATTPSSALSPFVAELTRAAQALAPPASGSTLSVEAERRIHTPVTSAEFPTRVSTELAVLARDGVQEARLHVSPEALGPIAVQIRLEGTAAQVSLAADSAQTRQVLEQSMPTLAAALRENGLTLTGGGVFQQSPQSGRDGSPDGGRPPSATGRERADGASGTDSAAVQASIAPRRARLPGQVDLYA